MGRALAAVGVVALAVVGAPAAAQQPLGSWGATGKAPDQFQRLGGIAADARGYVYAADHDGGGVLKYTATGQYVRTIGRPRPRRNIGDPAPLDEIGLPEGVAIGPDGNVYVVEAGSRTRVSVWTPAGRYLRAFADHGSRPGQLDSPGQVAVDGAGFVYVADSANHRVEKFTPTLRATAADARGQGIATTRRVRLR